MDIIWAEYKNQKFGVALSYPKHWEVQQLSPAMLVFSGPPAALNFRSQLSYQRSTPQGKDEAWFLAAIQASEAQQRAAYTDYQLIRSEQLTLAGARAFLRQAEWRYENTDIFSVNLQALIWPNAKVVFVLKAATLKTLAEHDLPILEHMITSTQLL